MHVDDDCVALNLQTELFHPLLDSSAQQRENGADTYVLKYVTCVQCIGITHYTFQIAHSMLHNIIRLNIRIQRNTNSNPNIIHTPSSFLLHWQKDPWDGNYNVMLLCC